MDEEFEDEGGGELVDFTGVWKGALEDGLDEYLSAKVTPKKEHVDKVLKVIKHFPGLTGLEIKEKFKMRENLVWILCSLESRGLIVERGLRWYMKDEGRI